MRTITINIKYNVGDRVWIMVDRYPTCLKIVRIDIHGGSEGEEGATNSLGKVTYFLSHSKYEGFSEAQLCDTFDELRDKVFCDEMRENIEQDEEEKEEG